MVAAVAVLYSLKILAVSAAFYVVRIDNLAHLFDAVFDAARWPAPIFRGAVRFVFTFVIPLALMTTYPARALLGTLPDAHARARGRGRGGVARPLPGRLDRGDRALHERGR